MGELEKLIQRQIPLIPAPVRDYLQSDRYPAVMRDIIKAYDLHLDTASKIEMETTLLLIGVVSPNEYEERLVQNAKLPRALAKKIVSDMNEQVFKQIVSAYKKPAPAPTVNAFADEIANEEAEEGSGSMREPEAPTQIPVENPKEEKKIEKKYAIDPYREPID